MKHDPRRRRLVLFSVIFLAAASSATAALAQTAVTRAQLQVDAEPGCATHAAIETRVRARSPQLAFTQAAVGTRSIRAAIARRPDGKVSARLSLTEGGRRSERQLEAASCEEAVEALALLITLALDASARERPAPRASPPQRELAVEPAAQPDAAPPTPQRATETSAAAPADPAQPAAPPEPPPEAAAPPSREPAAGSPSPSPASPPTAAGSTLALAASLEGRGVFGLAPGLLPGVGVSLMASWERDSIWSAAVGLTALHGWLSGVQAAGGRAAFQLQLGRLDACVVRVRVGPAVVRGCASGSLGRLHASGARTYDPASRSRLFAALGGGALLQLELGARLGLHAVAHVSHPLVRDSFAFRPRVFHRVSAVVADIGIGAGVRFP